MGHFSWVPIVLIAILGGFLSPFVSGCRAQNRIVVVYTSQDQVYAEPIFKGFTKQTGIEVRAVYDSEAVKTVGLVNRLIAEKNHPQCDVFWNNEELRTRQLAKQNLLRETNDWDSFGYRTRRLVINTNQWRNANCPRTLVELTNEICRGKVALAYPLFGTTSTHFLALRQQWGEERWEKWCRALAANKPFLVDGNSMVVKLVGAGEAWIGLTDSDDIFAGRREGLPIESISLQDEEVRICNTVAVIRRAPHPEMAQIFFDYLVQGGASNKLIEAGAMEGRVAGTGGGAGNGEKSPVNWEALLESHESGLSKLKEIFLR